MGRGLERLAVAQRALATLFQLSGLENLSPVERDAASPRFECTLEDFWKALQAYLREEGLEAASPKRVFRLAGEVGLMDEEGVRLALQMGDDRNLTVRTYNEALAQAIYRCLQGYARLMGSVLGRLHEGHPL
ncbi:nucleotidyltransferase substrate binding protein [Thermus sp.]|uniref:nucleotidyltransferase substrate binding protein n=1 Tax=Thermus sp. TaxID=275 RepID=UPI00307E249B